MSCCLPAARGACLGRADPAPRSDAEALVAGDSRPSEEASARRRRAVEGTIQAELLCAIESFLHRTVGAVDLPTDLTKRVVPILRPHRTDEDVLAVVLLLEVLELLRQLCRLRDRRVMFRQPHSSHIYINSIAIDALRVHRL